MGHARPVPTHANRCRPGGTWEPKGLPDEVPPRPDGRRSGRRDSARRRTGRPRRRVRHGSGTGHRPPHARDSRHPRHRETGPAADGRPDERWRNGRPGRHRDRCPGLPGRRRGHLAEAAEDRRDHRAGHRAEARCGRGPRRPPWPPLRVRVRPGARGRPRAAGPAGRGRPLVPLLDDAHQHHRQDLERGQALSGGDLRRGRRLAGRGAENRVPRSQVGAVEGIRRPRAQPPVRHHDRRPAQHSHVPAAHPRGQECQARRRVPVRRRRLPQPRRFLWFVQGRLVRLHHPPGGRQADAVPDRQAE